MTAGVPVAAPLSPHDRTVVVEQETQPGYHATALAKATAPSRFG